MNDALTKKYADLCMKLGDLEYKLKILTEDRDNTVRELKILNQMASVPQNPAPQAEESKKIKPAK